MKGKKLLNRKKNKTDKSQFISIRENARKPKYFYIRVFTPEPITTIILTPENYCNSVDDLPA